MLIPDDRGTKQAHLKRRSISTGLKHTTFQKTLIFIDYFSLYSFFLSWFILYWFVHFHFVFSALNVYILIHLLLSSLHSLFFVSFFCLSSFCSSRFRAVFFTSFFLPFCSVFLSYAFRCVSIPTSHLTKSPVCLSVRPYALHNMITTNRSK